MTKGDVAATVHHVPVTSTENCSSPSLLESNRRHHHEESRVPSPIGDRLCLGTVGAARPTKIFVGRHSSKPAAGCTSRTTDDVPKGDTNNGEEQLFELHSFLHPRTHGPIIGAEIRGKATIIPDDEEDAKDKEGAPGGA